MAKKKAKTTSGMKGYVATATLVGRGPISFGKPVATPKDTNETHEAHEERVWQERAHVDEKGKLFIPPIALKRTLESVASYLGEKIKGRGQATYTKRFNAGLGVYDPLPLNATLKDVEKEAVFGASDGKKGGSKRVTKFFPTLKTWKTSTTIHVYDDVVTPEVLQRHLEQAGMFVGLLRWRPANGGYYGRFDVEDFKVTKQ